MRNHLKRDESASKDSPLESQMKYRPDIDGLRAVAVLSVFVFHMNKAWLSGGFVGVDIFFVISGYLITSILNRDFQSGTFSFGDFYRRRLRRIQPVMWVVVLATYLVGLLVLSPNDLQFLANSIRSVISFTTNLFFAHNSNYFNPDSEQYPLLHFWSLAVEEQYYLIWPPLLYVVFRFKNSRRHLLGLAGILILGSALGGEWMLHHETLAKLAYYILPTRMGELAVGGLLAVWMDREPSFPITKFGLNFASVAGAVLILISFGCFSQSTSFPGWAALLPCTGAFLLIGAGPGALVNRYVLSRTPFVQVGLLSYSIYLWHYPVLAFLKYLGFINNLTLAAALFFVLALSYWSKNKIEDRFRHSKVDFKRAFWKFQLLPGLLALGVVVVTYDHDGLKERYVFSRGDLIEDMKEVYESYCHEQILGDCRIGDLQAPLRGLVFGDSHAGHFMPFWDDLGKARHFSLEARSAGSCEPIFEEIPQDGEICKKQKQWFRENYQKYSMIIFIARWDFLFTDGKFSADVREHLIQEFRKTLKTLQDHHIEVITMPQVPAIADQGFESALRRKYALLGLFSQSKGREVQVPFNPKVEEANADLVQFLQGDPEVQLFDPVSLCPEIRKRWPYREGGMAYRDYNHLNFKGAQELAQCYLKTGVPLPFH